MSMRLARRGGRYPVWAPTVAVGLAGRLRCDARATRAAAMPLAAPLNAPPLHGFSPVRRLRRRTSPCVAALLAAPQVATTGYRPPRCITEVFVGRNLSAAGKAVVGCASAATLCGAEERRAGRVARRLEATRRPYIVRAPSAAALRSSVAPARGRVCVAALAARAPQGSRPAGPTALHERRRAPGRGFASLARRALGPSLHLARTLHVVARPTWTTSSS